MKKHIRPFAIGAVVTLLIVALAVPVLASSGIITIQVSTNINIKVNGEVFDPEGAPVFVYDGVTYAPLRALANAYGLVVGYDSKAKMATVDAPDAASSTAPGSKPISNSTYSIDIYPLPGDAVVEKASFKNNETGVVYKDVRIWHKYGNYLENRDTYYQDELYFAVYPDLKAELIADVNAEKIPAVAYEGKVYLGTAANLFLRSHGYNDVYPDSWDWINMYTVIN